MKAAGSFKDMLERDVLRLGEQIDAWTNIERAPTICIRYEALWDRGDDLSDFLGIPINLPNKHQRESDQMPANIRDKIHSLYEKLDERIEALPDVFIVGAR